MQILFTAGYEGLTYFIMGNVHLVLVGGILVDSIAGSRVGVWINLYIGVSSMYIGVSSIRYYLSWAMFSAVAIILLKFLRQIVLDVNSARGKG